MKKQNKLARNTIKLRKAQNKRKDEPNKPKPKQSRKRLASRIVALFGCLLLVSALVVPCFAAPSSTADIDFDTMKILQFAVINEEYNQMFRSVAFTNFRDRVGRFGSGMERFAYLTGGNVVSNTSLSQEKIKLDLIDDDGRAAEFTSWVRGVSVSLYAKSVVNQAVILDMNVDSIDVEFYAVAVAGDTANFLELSFIYDDESIATLNYSVINGFYVFEDIDIGGRNYAFNSLSDLSIVISSTDNDNVNLANNISLLLFGNSSVAYPKTQYDTFMRLWTAAKEKAIHIEESAYNDGLRDGDGDYEAGYGEGYNEGFNEAVSQIDSGDYGRNLLGNALAAPFDAVMGIELVSWTLNNGTHFSINLGMIFSAFVGVTLFIWFLKMFAGG